MSALPASTPRAVLSAATGSVTTRYSSVRLQVESATASLIGSVAVRSARTLTDRPSVRARRSRSSSGAVLWETPRASSSDIGFVLASGGGRRIALLGEARHFAQLALDPGQLGRHDRQVDQDQQDEDHVGAGDVLSGLIEGQGGH